MGVFFLGGGVVVVVVFCFVAFLYLHWEWLLAEQSISEQPIVGCCWYWLQCMET